MYPNNDPAAFMVAFYGCLLAEVVPVPIEVPLTKKVKPAEQNNLKRKWKNLALLSMKQLKLHENFIEHFLVLV